MCRSTVKWFNVAKGFGFITPDDSGTDLFVPPEEGKPMEFQVNPRYFFEGNKAVRMISENFNFGLDKYVCEMNRRITGKAPSFMDVYKDIDPAVRRQYKLLKIGSFEASDKESSEEVGLIYHEGGRFKDGNKPQVDYECLVFQTWSPLIIDLYDEIGACRIELLAKGSPKKLATRKDFADYPLHDPQKADLISKIETNWFINDSYK